MNYAALCLELIIVILPPVTYMYTPRAHAVEITVVGITRCLTHTHTQTWPTLRAVGAGQ